MIGQREFAHSRRELGAKDWNLLWRYVNVQHLGNSRAGKRTCQDYLARSPLPLIYAPKLSGWLLPPWAHYRRKDVAHL